MLDIFASSDGVTFLTETADRFECLSLSVNTVVVSDNFELKFIEDGRLIVGYAVDSALLVTDSLYDEFDR